MGKIDVYSERRLKIERRELHKEGKTLVQNKKTKNVFVRMLTTHPQPEPSEKQSVCRSNFGVRSHEVSLWLKANDPTACPPDGSPLYQEMWTAYERQDKYKPFINFLKVKLPNPIE